MTQTPDSFTFDRVVRMVLSAILLVSVFLLLRYLADVLIPFAAAVVLAYLLNPLVNAFEQKTRRRGLAVGMTLTMLAIVAAAMIVVLVPLVFSQAKRFGRDLEKLQQDLSVFTLAAPEPTVGPDPEKSIIGFNETVEALGQLKNPTDENETRRARFTRARETLKGTYIGDVVEHAIMYSQTDEFRSRLIGLSESFLTRLSSMFTSLINIVIALGGLIIVFLYLVFLLLDYPTYARTWSTFLPPNYRDGIVSFLLEFDVALRRYFRGQALIAAMMAIVFSVGFMLIGLPMALPLGLFIGLLNMVPYLQTIGLIPALMMAALKAVETDASFSSSILLTLAVFGIAQVIQDGLITPKFMGQATGLRPLAILLGVFIWGKLLGFLGVLLAIPLTCLGIAYYRRFVLSHTLEDTLIVNKT